jgi:hypothetical protein
MSFDKDTRNLLARTVTACRRRLTEDVTSRLTGLFGLHPDGTVLALNEMTHLSPDQAAAAGRLRDLLDHYTAGAVGGEKDRRKSAYERMTLEISFTILNRLAALRLCEERGLVVECVRRGTASDGFRLFERVSGGALGGRYDTYRVFLECLFDELALDLGVLFDRTTPQSAIFPSERCMEDVLDELNKPGLTHLWTEDETIGWVYQYFNPPEERKAMRDASAAPRNSRELAVRNQFFTPRYVVEFLTDNTLGRIWYEMRKGDTALKDKCRYLVRRPNEIFLAAGEKAPLEAEGRTDLSQDELLKQPVYIEHRPKKDPRDLRILDPASGSGHFLLYTFDLMVWIYEEAWCDPESPKFESTRRTLQEDFDTLEALHLEIPKLIIEHNLHGIDIDPRAVQIAALALWLRAQKSWKKLGIKASERPRVAKSNIVAAEPMPGEADMKEEFISGLKPRILGQFVDAVFDRMKLAGEAGSLLKIEEEIKDVVSKAKEEYRKELHLRKEEAGHLPGMAPERAPILFDFADMSDEDFLDQSEEAILTALKEYAERAENDHTVRRRLFANDAARGFSFIELCRKRYDVVLMNPPFGDSPGKVKFYLKKYFGFGRPDAYMCFVFRSKELLLWGGRAGAITSRTFLTLQFFEYLRDLLLEGSLRLDELIDLGSGVLDGATVDTCAYCSEKSELWANPIFFNIEDHHTVVKLVDEIEKLNGGRIGKSVYPTPRHEIAAIPGRVFAYRMVPSIRRAFVHFPPLDQEFAMEVLSPRTKGNHSAHVRQGLIPGDQFRFSRLATEVPPQASGWKWAAKGGDYAKFVSLDDLMIKWHLDGKEIKMYAEINYGGASRTIKNEQYFFRRGISFPRVSSVGLNARVLAEGSVFTDTGMAVIVDDPKIRLSILGFLNSRLADYCCNSLHPGRKFEIAHVSSLPLPQDLIADAPFRENVEKAIHLVWRIHSADEDLPFFLLPTLPKCIGTPDASDSFAPSVSSVANELALLQESINREVFRIFRIPEDEQKEISEALYQKRGGRLPAVTNIYLNPELNFDDHFPNVESTEIANLISYLLGTSLGRWDIRYATGERQAPEIPDPFDPLPVCPPGMLQNAEGLPAELGDVPADYPLRITWDGILVDDPGFNEAHPHRDDIIRRVREVFDLLWKDKAHEIEQETCDILGVSDLRDYFRKPAKFFQDHLKRYSKSRRKAPIYWPLSTASGSYTIWFYYHRLNEQTLYTAVNQYVEPKISEVERGLARIEDELQAATGGEATRLRDRFNETQTFLGELRDFREELLRIAALPYKPDLNDGVIINAAPLNSLFNLRSWANDTKKIWDKLNKGDYDWAHLAYTIWPDRVRDVCKKDRSIAIAHGLEDLCEVEAPKTKKRKKP